MIIKIRYLSLENDLDKTVAKTPETIMENSVDFQIENVTSYTSKVLKAEPIADSHGLFIKDQFQYEKQRFHQEIFNEIVANINTSEAIQIKEIQKFYIEHLHRVVKLETFNCSLCHYETIHKGNLRCHLLFIHSVEMEVLWLKCSICPYKSTSKDFIKTHFETEHKNQKIIMKKKNIEKTGCKNKNKASSTRLVPQNYECDLCDFETKQHNLFATHKHSHRDSNNSNRFLCYACDYSPTKKTALQQHLLKTHQIVTKGACNLKQNFQQCNKCEYQSISKESFRVHSERHKNPEDVKWLKCSHCHFQTKHRMSLRYHVRNHNLTEQQLRKYMCDVCSNTFKQKSVLDLHMITHKSMDQVSKIFKCCQCPYQAKFKRNLNIHMVVHKEPEFVCDMCGHRSKRKDNHNKHLLTHKAFNESLHIFKCSLCPYESHIKAYLGKHIKKHLVQL